MTAAFERLVWELEVGRGQGGLFAAHIGSSDELGELERRLAGRGLEVLMLDVEASRALVSSVTEGGRLPDVDAVLLTDALATQPSEVLHKANCSRESWVRDGHCVVFGERAAGSPEVLRELRDLVAIFRDIVDLRPDVGRDDHLWDTGDSASLKLLARRVPTTTRGSSLIIEGRVHHKHRPALMCPDCGAPLSSAVVEVRFEHAPEASAVQRVRGFRCECGAQWPDPRAMRDAHARAFGVGTDPTH